MTKPKIYLAGPVDNISDPGSWRDTIEYKYGDEFEILNPLSKYDVPVDQLTITWDRERDERTGHVAAQEIVDRDLKSIDEADAVLVRWDAEARTIGTPMEIMYAWNEHDMPIALREPADPPPEWELSPWAVIPDYRSVEMQDCVNYLRGLFSRAKLQGTPTERDIEQADEAIDTLFEEQRQEEGASGDDD